MKKTLQINLNGIVFNIDDDAYAKLDTYLSEVGAHFTNDERKEIMRDIEARIAELFCAKKLDRFVVTLADVEAVEETLGHPEQFENENNESEENHAKTSKPTHKFYRDDEDKIIAGVASGFAALVGWDTTLVRLLFLLLALVTSGYAIMCYVILWIIVPKAVTTAQRLEMRGQAVTVDSIKNAFQTDQQAEKSNRTETIGKKFGAGLLSIAKAFLIVFGIMLGLTCIGIIAVVLFALNVFLTASSSVIASLPGNWSWIVASPWAGNLCIVALCLIVLIPIVALIYGCICLIRRNKGEVTPRRRWLGWTMLAVWFVSLIIFVCAGTYCGIHRHDITTHFATFIDDDNYKFAVSEKRVCAPFTSINADNYVRVALRQSDTLSVEVNAPEDQLRNITTEVKDGVLTINNNNNINIVGNHNNPRATIYVSAPAIAELAVDNASKIICQNTIDAPILLAKANNASSIDLRCASETIKITAKNASAVHCETNNAQHVTLCAHDASKVEMMGSANTIDAEALSASKVDLSDAKAHTICAHAQSLSKIAVGKAENATLKASEASKIKYRKSTTLTQQECDETSKIKIY